MAEKGRGTHQALLNDPDVQRWYDNLERGAKATADNYLRILGRFLNLNDLTPKGFVRLKAKKRDDVVTDHITRMLKEGRAGSTAAVTKKAIVSWLDWNGHKLGRRIKIPGVHQRPTLKDAHIPTQDELRRVLNLADARSRCALAFIAYAGLRPEVLGDYTGHAGLTLGDLPELKLAKGEVSLGVVPTRVMVSDDLSKTDKPYFTFVGPEGCDYLASYLGKRVEEGETLTKKSPVILSRNPEKPFLRSLKISDMIRKPMRAAGLREPPYIWRSYFASRAMLSESKGLTRSYRDFFMGHAGDMDAVYTLHKKLPKDTVEAMRQGYEAALTHLETRGQAQAPSDARLIRLMLRAQGVPAEEADALDVDGLSDEEVAQAIEELLDQYANTASAPKPTQRVIQIEGLESALGEGWVFRATLPDGRAVVELNMRAAVDTLPAHNGQTGDLDRSEPNGNTPPDWLEKQAASSRNNSSKFPLGRGSSEIAT